MDTQSRQMRACGTKQNAQKNTGHPKCISSWDQCSVQHTPSSQTGLSFPLGTLQTKGKKMVVAACCSVPHCRWAACAQGTGRVQGGRSPSGLPFKPLAYSPYAQPEGGAAMQASPPPMPPCSSLPRLRSARTRWIGCCMGLGDRSQSQRVSPAPLTC